MYSSHDCIFLDCPNIYKQSIKKSSYLVCSKCNLLFYLPASKVLYEDNYFGKEYEQQYGKSYIADKENIQKKNKQRIASFKKVLSKDEYWLKQNKKNKGILCNKNVLEIGSAAGFFLETMQQEGCNVEGWEISASMSEVANKAHVRTKVGDFETLFHKQKRKKYDIIAAFYVIEHIADPFFPWRAFQKLLKPNGYLLLAMPSYWGPTFYFNKYKWLMTHPKDHFVDYSIRSVRIVAKQFGFSICFKTADGIHPNRFPFGKFSWMNKIYTYIQRRFAFGDTIYLILKK